MICDRSIAARVKGKICKTLARPAVMNGLETVALTKTEKVELEAVELSDQRPDCEAGYRIIQVTSELTLDFPYYKGGLLLTLIMAHCHDNLCCKPNLLWSMLCSSLETNQYEITA